MSRRDFLKHLGFTTQTAITMSHIRCNCKSPKYNPIGRCLSCGGFHEGDTPMAKGPDKPPSTDDMNEAIAIFDGWEFHKGDPDHKCKFCFAGDEPCTPAVDRFIKGGRIQFHYELKYHSSWDALMPVWKRLTEAVAGLTEEGDYPADFSTIMDMYAYHCEQVDITAANDIVFKGIQWHNQQKQINEK